MKRVRSRLLLATALVCQLCGWMIGQVQSTGAIPGDEFQAAGFLYGILDPIAWIALVLVTCSAIVLLIESRMALRLHQKQRAILSFLGCVFFVAGIFLPIAFAPAILVIFLIDELRDQRNFSQANKGAQEGVANYRRALADLTWRDIVVWWAELGMVAALAALAIGLIESFTYTASFAGWLFAEDALWSYRIRLIDLSITFGATTSLLYVVPMIVDRLLRKETEAAWGAIRRSRLVVALVATGFIASGLFSVIGDEITKTGVLLPTITLLLFLWGALARLMSRNLVAIGFAHFDGEPCTRASAWGLLFLSILGLPVASLPGKLGEKVRKRPQALFAAFFLVSVVWEFALVYMAYPELEDFRSRLILLSVISAVNVSVLTFFALAFVTKRFRTGQPKAVGIWMFLIVIVFGFGSSFRPLNGNVALIINEYSRFGFMMKKSSFREIIRLTDDAGYVPTSVEFVEHGPQESQLPTLVPAPLVGKRPPIVIVLWDAARPDHMGAYGYERPTTPHMDEFAKESVVFEQAYSGATATTCGVRHLFTGHYSTRYMLSRDHEPFFVHALRKRGYRKFLITATGTDYNGVSLDSFKRGGDAAEMDGSEFRHLALHPQGLDRERPDPEKTNNVIEAWRSIVKVEGKAGLNGSLTFLHLTGTHFPWRNRNAVVDFGQGNVDLYDGETAKVDALTKEAFDTLKELGVYDDAIILLVADHGTGLMEHGRWAGFLPYEEQIRVPFIFKIPGVEHRQVKAAVSTIDVAPTILGILSPGSENAFDGVSLMGLAMGKQDKLERKYIVSFCSFEDAYSLIEDGRWKLHYHRRENYALLFDLENDPKELVNLHDREPIIRDRLIEQMRAFLWEGRHDYGNPYHYRDFK